VVVISSKPSRANNELSTSRLESPVLVGPLPIWRTCKAQKGRGAAASCARDLIGAGSERDPIILSGSSLPSLRLGAAFSLRAEPEMFRRTFATIAALNAGAFCLG
jgi:hypothetical protein